MARLAHFSSTMRWITAVMLCMAFAISAMAQDEEGNLGVILVGQGVPDVRTLEFEIQAIRPDGTAAVLLSGDVDAVVSGYDETLTGATVTSIPIEQRRPQSFVLVVDVTDTIPIAVINAQLPSMLRQLSAFPDREVSVVAFSDQITAQFPFSSDLEGAAAFVSTLEIDLIPPNANVVVSGLETGIQTIEENYREGRDYSIILVTDAVQTDFVQQTELATLNNRAIQRNMRFYAITLPSLGTDEYPDAQIPQSLARTIGGVAYLYDETQPLTEQAANTFLAERINRLMSVLTNASYRVRLTLDELRGRGLSGSLAIQLDITDGELRGNTRSEFEYREESYTVSLEGLNAAREVTGPIELTAVVQPALPAGPQYNYAFTISDPDGSGEILLECADATQPRCALNPALIGDPGRRLLTVRVSSGVQEFARQFINISIVRENLDVTFTQPLFGQVTAAIATGGMNRLADTALIFVGDQSTPIGRAGMGNDGSETFITFDADDLRGALTIPPDQMTAQVAFRVELRRQETVIARWRGGTQEVLFTPTVTFEGLSRDSLITESALTLTLTINPGLPGGAVFNYLFNVNNVRRSETITLDCANPLAAACQWDLNSFPAGEYTLEAIIRINNEQDYVRTEPIVVNVVKSGVRVVLPDLVFGTVPVTVETLTIPFSTDNRVAELYAGFGTAEPQRVASAPINAQDGTVEFELDIEALRRDSPGLTANDATDAPLMVRVDVKDEETRTLLATGSVETAQAYFQPARIALNALPDLVTGSIDLQVETEPALPSSLAYRYQFIVVSESQDDERILQCADATQPVCTLDTLLIPPGSKQVHARILSGDVVIGATLPERINVYRDDLDVRLPEQLVGLVPITIDTQGYGELASEILVTASLDGSQETVLRESVSGDSETRITLDLDRLRNNHNAANPDAPITGTAGLLLRIDLRNQNTNDLIARFAPEEAIPVRFSPETISLIGLESNEIAREQILLLSSNEAGEDLAATGYTFEFTVNGETLACADSLQPQCRWDLETVPAGWYDIGATVFSGEQVVQVVTPVRVNVYLDSLSITPIDVLSGVSQISVDTRGLDADVLNVTGTLILPNAPEPIDLGQLATVNVAREALTVVALDTNAIRERLEGDQLVSAAEITLELELENRSDSAVVARHQVPNQRIIFSPERVSLDGVNQDEEISGDTSLSMTLQPPPLDVGVYTFEYVIDGTTVIQCAAPGAADCAWNTVQVAPGFRQIVGRVLVDDRVLAETDPRRVNVVRESLILDYPSVLIGTVPLSVRTTNLPGASRAILEYTIDGTTSQTITEQVDRESELAEFTLNIDAVRNRLAADEDGVAAEETQVSVRVQVLDESNAILSRSSADLTVRYTPRVIAIAGLEFGSLVTGTQTLDLMLNDPPLPSGATYEYAFLVSDGEENRPLSCANPAEPRCTWNTDSFAPGRHTLIARVLSEDEVELASLELEINVYRNTLQAVVPQLLVGSLPIEVENSQLPPNSRLDVFVSRGAETDQLIGTRPVLTSETETSLAIDASVIRDVLGITTESSAQMTLRVEVRDNDENLLLNQWESDRRLHFTVPRVTLSGVAASTPISEPVSVGIDVTPALPTGFDYDFELMVGSQVIPCSDLPQVRCEWDTSQFTPGRYRVSARIRNQDRIIVQSDAAIPINVFTESMQVSLPPTLVGQVDLRVYTAGLPGDSLELYGTFGPDGEAVLLDSAPKDNTGETLLTLDIESLRTRLIVDEATGNTAPISLTIDLISTADNLRYSRWTDDLTVLLTPQYERSTLIPAGPDAARDLTEPISGSLALTLSNTLTPFSALNDQLALIVVNPDDTITVLEQTTEPTLDFVLDTSTLPPGRNSLRAVILRGTAPVSEAVIAASRPLTLNVYRTLEGVSIDTLRDQVVYGNAIITVSTAGLVDAGVVDVSVVGDGTVQRVPVSGSDAVEVAWNIDERYFSTGSLDPIAGKVLLIDVRNQTDDALLARRVLTLTLAPTVRYRVTVEGLPTSLTVRDPLQLSASIEPVPPGSGAISYMYWLIPDGGDAADRIFLYNAGASTPQRIDMFESNVQPGSYLLQVNAMRDSAALATNEQRIRVINTTSLVPRASFAQERMAGTATAELDVYPNVARVRITFTESGLAPREVLVRPVDASLTVIRETVDWQTLYFSEGSAPDRTGTLSVTLLDVNNDPLYEWAGTRIIGYDNSAAWWEIALVVVAVGAIGYFTLRVVRVQWRRYKRQVQGATNMGEFGAMLLEPGQEVSKDPPVPLGQLDRPLLVGRIVKKAHSFDRIADIGFTGATVSRREGVIRQETGGLYFYPDKKRIAAIYWNGDKLTDAGSYEADKKRIRIPDDDQTETILGFGKNGLYRIVISGPELRNRRYDPKTQKSTQLSA